MSKIDYKKYPKLNEQVTYLQDLQNLVILLKNKINLLSGEVPMNAITENDNKIAIIKTKLEIEGIERKIEQKKSTCHVMQETLEEVLSEMESNYDVLIERASLTGDDGCSLDDKANAIAMRSYSDIKNDEDRVAQYLDLKEYFNELDKSISKVESGRIVPLNSAQK